MDKLLNLKRKEDGESAHYRRASAVRRMVEQQRRSLRSVREEHFRNLRAAAAEGQGRHRSNEAYVAMEAAANAEQRLRMAESVRDRLAARPVQVREVAEAFDQDGWRFTSLSQL